jgi:NitT/TauT family transport system permease protein
MKNSTIFLKFLKGIAVFLFWLFIWYIAAFFVNKEIFLPFPHTVADRFLTLCQKSEFWLTCAVSLLRILRGFLYGVVLGFVTAVLTYYIPLAKTLIAPFLRTVRAVPVVSFILLAFLWLDNDAIPVFIALLMVLPIIWENLSAGFNSLDKGLNEMALVYKIPRRKSLVRIILPQLKPHFYSGCLTSMGLAWKSGIAAEVISYPTVAIGKAMNNAKTTLDTAEVLVWTVTLVALSLIFEGLFKMIFKKGSAKL